MNARRSGFTLVELLVVLVVGTLIMGAVYQTLASQRQGYRAQSATVGRQQLARMGLDLLTGELREVSASVGDLVLARPDSIAVRAYRKVGVSCNVNPPGDIIDLWVMADLFEEEDSIAMFIDGDPDTSADDTWGIFDIDELPGVVAFPASCTDWFRLGADGTVGAAFPIQRVKVTDEDFSAALLGAPVRSFTRVTYGRFQNGAGEWMLARRNQDGQLVELLGPIASNVESGPLFRFFDTNGVEITGGGLANVQSISRIAVRVPALTPAGNAPESALKVDSLQTILHLRNNTIPFVPLF